MGKIISNGIEYVGLTNINGVFIDTNNIVVPTTVVAGSTTATYTATEDSYAYINLSIHSQKQVQVYINDEEIAWAYTDSSYNLQSNFFPLKKGQTLKIVNGDDRTDNCRYTIYGVQQSSTSQGSSGVIDYSTTEQKTGQKWIDGKDIYQKTIEIQANSLTGGQENTVIHGILNFGQLVKKETIYNYSGGDMNTDVVNPTVSAWFMQVHDVGDTDFSVYVGNSAYAQLSKIYVTLQYTKSTT